MALPVSCSFLDSKITGHADTHNLFCHDRSHHNDPDEKKNIIFEQNAIKKASCRFSQM